MVSPATSRTRFIASHSGRSRGRSCRCNADAPRETDHGVLFMGFVTTAPWVGVLIGAWGSEHPHDDRSGQKGRPPGAIPSRQLGYVELPGALVARPIILVMVAWSSGGLLIPNSSSAGVDPIMRLMMNSRRAKAAGIRQLGKIEGAVRIADVHHDLDGAGAACCPPRSPPRQSQARRHR